MKIELTNEQKEIIENLYHNDLPEEVYLEYIEYTNDKNLDNFEENYNGYFSSDEEFAQDMAEQLGMIDNNATWPNNCIDWKQASYELMFDYYEIDGHYFRS